MNFQEFDKLVNDLIYSENYKVHLEKLEKLNIYEKRQVIRAILTFFVNNERFIEIAEKINQLILRKDSYHNVIEYVRKYAEINKNLKPWYIYNSKFNYSNKILKEHFPAIFKNDLDVSFFMILYEKELTNIIKFINNPAHKLDSESYELFKYLEKNKYNIMSDFHEENVKKLTENNIYIYCDRSSDENVYVCRELSKNIRERLIKSKFEDDKSICSKCPYKEYSFTLFDEINTTSKDDRIDVLFIGMNPYKDEIKEKKPFKGKAGSILRKCIEESYLRDSKILIYNSIPCFIPENGNPIKEIIVTCGVENIKEVINKVSPRSIIFLGDVAIQTFQNYLLSLNYPSSQEIIRKMKHNFVRTENGKIISSTYHPSYLNYNHKPEAKNTIIKTFNIVAKNLLLECKEDNKVKHYVKNDNNVTNYLSEFSFVKEIVDSGFCLTNLSFLDTFAEKQNQFREKRLVARFRNCKDPSDYFFLDLTELISYVYFELKNKDISEYLPLITYDKVTEKKVSMLSYLNNSKVRESIKQKFTYESDIDELDYFIIKYGEITNFTEMNPTMIQICYTDIEIAIPDNVYNKNSSIYDVLLVTNIIDNKVKVHICKETICKYNNENLDSASKKAIDNVISTLKEHIRSLYKNEFDIQIHTHNTEKELLNNVVREWSSCDVITGWNVYFDVNYIASRCKELKVDILDISALSTNKEMYRKYNVKSKNKYTFHLSGRYGTFYFPASYAIDLLQLYRQIEKVESYSLAYVSEYLLGTSKVKIESNMINQIRKDISKFIEYNIQDTFLCKIISDKKGLLLPVLGQSCVSFSSIINVANTTLKPIDSLVIKTARKRNYLVRTSNPYPDSFQKLGGYVRNVNKVLRNNIICLDVTSMYPNLIVSFNVSFDTYKAHIDGQLVGNETTILQIVDTVSEFINCIRNNEKEIDETKNIVVDVTLDPLTNNIKKKMSLFDIAKFVFENNYIITPRGTIFSNEEDGLAVDLMKELLEKRSVYKKRYTETKNEIDELFSQAYKILANAYYGAHGNQAFRFFSVYLAETITFLGQIVIRISQCSAEKYINSEVK